MEAPQRSRFVKFMTGSKRLPIGGFKNLNPNISINPRPGTN